MWLLKIFCVILSIFLTSIDASSLEFNKKDFQEIVNNFNDSLSYRLPNTSIPLRYFITIASDIHENDFEFIGNVKINMKILEPTQQITMHSKHLEIEKIDILTPDGLFPIINDADFELIESHDFLVIKLPKIYQPNTEFMILISYRGLLNDQAVGFYRASYIHNNVTLKWYAATQFQMSDARRALPCYDEPGIRAAMTLTLIHGKEYNAISNTLVYTKTDLGDRMLTSFETTDPIQTYLFAFVLSDFSYIYSSVNNRIHQSIFGTPEDIREGRADYAASTVGPILDVFENTLQVPYPFKKMDHVALNAKFSMENIGLIIYPTSYLMLDPQYDNRQRITDTIIHEYAHQWFGNIVSPKWWQFIWLNEGFATFFGPYISNLLYPGQYKMNKFFTTITPNAFQHDVKNSWPLNHYTDHPDELPLKFNEISYYKAACVIRMFMEVMTEPVFLKGLSYYLFDNHMQAVTPNDLHLSLQIAYNQAFPNHELNLASMMMSWEDLPGYPLISVRIVGNSLEFSQRRYPESNGEIYNIPVTFATKTNPDFSSSTRNFWLLNNTMSMQQSALDYSPGDWIILNNQQVGYYRVDYEFALWQAIIQQLNDNHYMINLINRVVLQDEYWIAYHELARVYAADGLRLINYFDKEDYVEVWSRASVNIEEMNYKLLGTNVYESFQEMLRRITKSHLNNLGYDDIEGEDLESRNFRNILKSWNCRANDGQCLVSHYSKFLQFRSGRGNANFDFCSALKVVEKATFTEILNDIINDKNVEHRQDYVDNMGCSMIHENLELLLEAILDPENELPGYDANIILKTMTKSSNEALIMVVDFVDQNYAALENVLYSYFEILYQISQAIKEEEIVSKFSQTLNRLTANGYITVAGLNFLMSYIKSNENWLDTNYYEIRVFFGLEEPTTTTTSTTITSTTEGPSTTPQSTTEGPSTTPQSTTGGPSTTPQSTTPAMSTTTEDDNGMTIALSMSLVLACLLIHLINA